MSRPDSNNYGWTGRKYNWFIDYYCLFLLSVYKQNINSSLRVEVFKLWNSQTDSIQVSGIFAKRAKPITTCLDFISTGGVIARKTTSLLWNTIYSYHIVTFYSNHKLNKDNLWKYNTFFIAQIADLKKQSTVAKDDQCIISSMVASKFIVMWMKW